MITDKDVKDKVSIIIPAYNRKMEVSNCIDSILKQDYKNKEIIIVDDASSDNTSGYIKKKYPFVKVIVNKENKGPNYCRNLGIARSSSEFILILDSDIELTNRKQISNMINISKRVKNLGELGSFYEEPDKKITACSFDKMIYFRLKNKNSLQKCDYVGSGNLFIRKKLVYQNKGFDEFVKGDNTDAEMGLNLKREGYVNLFGPSIAAKHHKSEKERDNIGLRATFKKPKKLRVIWSYRMRLRHFFKNYGTTEALAILFARFIPKILISILAFIKQQFLGLKTKDSEQFPNLKEKIRRLLILISLLVDSLFWNIRHHSETIKCRRINFLRNKHKI